MTNDAQPMTNDAQPMTNDAQPMTNDLPPKRLWKIKPVLYRLF